jgi:hypothetical protein
MLSVARQVTGHAGVGGRTVGGSAEACVVVSGRHRSGHWDLRAAKHGTDLTVLLRLLAQQCAERSRGPDKRRQLGLHCTPAQVRGLEKIPWTFSNLNACCSGTSRHLVRRSICPLILPYSETLSPAGSCLPLSKLSLTVSPVLLLDALHTVVVLYTEAGAFLPCPPPKDCAMLV